MKKILILCTGNSCRSQMAEGFFRKYRSKWDINSAGIMPSRVNPYAIEVMKELGIDISSHRSKSVDEFLGQDFDYIITVCDNAKESCPNFPGKTKMVHWNFIDPDSIIGNRDKRLEAFRMVRDQINEKIKGFLDVEV